MSPQSDPALKDGPATNPGTQPAARRLRSDAERNRRRILAAAAELFAQQGLGVTLDEVAEQAGVGVGTVYRRFPDKEALLSELLREWIEQLARAATDALAEEDPWTGLVSLLEYVARSFASNVGLREILMSGTYGGQDAAFARQKMHPVGEELLRRAKAAGQIRADLSTSDVPLIGFMLGTVSEYAAAARPEIWQRYLALFLDGIRPSRLDATPLPVDALSPPEMEAALTARARGPRPERRPG